MKAKVRTLVGSGVVVVASLLLCVAAIQGVALTLDFGALDSSVAVIWGAGLLFAALAAYLRGDPGLFHRFLLLPVNLGSFFLLLGAIWPEFLGQRTSLTVALICTVLLVVCSTISFKSQLLSESRAARESFKRDSPY